MLPSRALRPLVFVSASILFGQGRAQLTYPLGNTQLLIDEVVDSSRVDIPWEIIWGPDDRLWMTDGPRIVRWDPTTDMLDTLLDRGHGNGMGLALHPDFPNTPQVFAVFDSATYYGGGQFCEVFRYTYDPQGDTLIDEALLDSFHHQGEHSGGRILFDTTGALLINTPEWYNGIEVEAGCTFRIMPDGSIPPDNPWGDHRWTRGHRNAQGLAILPNGSIVNTELCDNGSEIDLLTAGRNYGWNEYDGLVCYNQDSCGSPQYTHEAPMTWFGQPVSGCEFYTSNAIPEFTNKLITCGLMSGGFMVVPFSSGLDSAFEATYITGGPLDMPMITPTCGRIRDIAIKPDGSFYLITNDRMDARIRWVHPELSTSVSENSTNGPQVWPNPTNGLVNLAVSKQASILVMDGLGRPVDVPAQRMGDRYLLDLSDQASGMYSIRLMENGVSSTTHVMKR